MECRSVRNNGQMTNSGEYKDPSTSLNNGNSKEFQTIDCLNKK